MAVVMQIEDDPNASTGATGVFVLAAIAFTVGAASLYRPMLHTRPTDEPLALNSADVGDGTQSLDQPRRHGATR